MNTSVSRQAGVRLGAKLIGYCEGDGYGDEPVIPISASALKGKGDVTLEALIKKVGMDVSQHTLVFETPVAYRTHLAKIDAKLFGLPQTRTRIYMLIWQARRTHR